MKKLLLLSALLLFQGCSFNQLFLSDEIDSVNIVKYTPKVKEHRAYFTREGLRPVLRKQKYLFVFRPKEKHLYVLLHKENRYLLYNLSVPNKQPITFTVSSEKQLLRSLRKAGYMQPENLEALGFTVKTGLRRYKGVKTIMIDVKEHRPSKKKEKTQNSTKQTVTNLQEPDTHSDLIEPLYPYYLHDATQKELSEYLHSGRAKKELSHGEISMLEHRLAEMKKRRFLQEAPLEALIAEYKKNKDPEFKRHIQLRIKELQEQ
ncbi:MAG: hypothetical protein L3J47_12685 [Sulfurovum sp.]|nr:hypothetical protein [Sulfurovum sp.]